MEELRQNNSDIQILPEYQDVKDVIDSGLYNLIFVTGGAGTGKSTMIRWLLQEYDGKVLLGAPTGIAAINIGGKTLHSLCQLPPAWITEEDIKQNFRRKELREAKVLIIDEISMVNPNMLDAIDKFFQKNRFSSEPFGGLAVVMIGDLFQLPSIINSNTRKFFMEEYGGSSKFYKARCVQSSKYYIVELDKVFRQKDQLFIDVLSDIREGKDLTKAVAVLNSRCTITRIPPQGSVWLCPRNMEVDNHNARELAKIEEPPYSYRGELRGSFRENNLPAPLILTLKEGAQIMFTQNDPGKRWVNGSIGVVTLLDTDDDGAPIIEVELETTGEIVNVGMAKWSDYKYDYNEKLKCIERMETGRYSQYPLVLAWAITIHKSQGQTIENVHIDLGAGAFEVGQTYVAISRCRSMEGLTFSRPLSTSDIIVDSEVMRYYTDFRYLLSLGDSEEEDESGV